MHPKVKKLGMETPAVVICLDDISEFAADRGQHYTTGPHDGDKGKAVWPTVKRATEAAVWAATKFGKSYGVFALMAVAEPKVAPVTVTKFRSKL